MLIFWHSAPASSMAETLWLASHRAVSKASRSGDWHPLGESNPSYQDENLAS